MSQLMTRWQRILSGYLLRKLSKPRIVQRITRHIHSGGIGKHGDELHTGTYITDHGDLSGLSDDDHLQYLPLTGIRTMTGNLQMGAYAVQFSGGGGIYEAANIIYILPIAGAEVTGNLNITGNLDVVGLFNWPDLVTTSTAGTIQTKTGASNVINLQGRKGALPILVTVAQIVNSAAPGVNPWLDIPLAGDITGSAGKTLSFPTISAGNGASGSFTTTDGKTVTVTNGIVTSIV